MSVLCGTDLSDSSMRAVEAAARLAARLNQPLHLVHALEPGHSQRQLELRSAEIDWVESGLRRLAAFAQEQGARVEIHTESGVPDDVLVDLAERLKAQLIVVAALGFRSKGPWQVGSHAERLAQRSHVPLLVVRDPGPLMAWASGTRPLRILLGADASRSSQHALRFIEGLSALGPCEVTVAHLYWPPEQFKRLGLHGIRSYVEPDPDVTRALEREYSERFGAAGLLPPRFRLEPHMGNLGDRIARLADEEGADLVVVGSHGRTALERIAEGSVSRDVLQHARVTVACVPAPATEAVATPTELHDVVVATDFSPAGNAAVPLAYSVAARGGTVHLVHVLKERNAHPARPHDIFADPSEHAEVRARLAELALAPSSAHPVSTKIHVITANDTGEALCQAAERLNASALCVGSHGGGLSQALLGSVAGAVVRGTRRPVLLAREPRI